MMPDDVEITLEPMPQPFSVADADGVVVYRDAFSYADRHGKTTAQLHAMAQARYDGYLAAIQAAQDAPPVDDPPEDTPSEGA